MTVELRPIGEDEVDAYAGQLSRVFSGNRPLPTAVDWLRRRIELDRTLAGFEQGGMVASAAAITMTITVPGGGQVGCAGVTGVSVLPTHRRRGILSALMRRQLDDVHERGEPVAALYASQAPIYGRFGYGIGTWHAEVALPRGRSALRTRGEDRRPRLVEREEAVRAATRVHDLVAAQHPGAVHRAGEFWEGRFADLPEQRGGASELNHAVLDGPDGPEGFVSYRLRRNPMHSNGVVAVRDLLAATPEASLALWRYCTGIDLSHRLTAGGRPLGEPVQLALADPRALSMAVDDGIWVRLVDLRAALAARRYAASGRLVLRVHDEFCPWNDGTWELEAGPDGAARCEPGEGAADLELATRDLASAYLGANSFARLAAAALVSGSREAVARADALFRTDGIPWCPTHF